jgi:uncharacterized protein (DUF433 family)
MQWQDHIEEDPKVMLGKPVFKGTRLTVEHVLEELGNGITQDELRENHPRLRPEHIRAAFQYAAAVLKLEHLVATE